MAKPHIQIILGSTRKGRFGEQPARWIFEKLSKNADVTSELVDLRDFPLPFYDEEVSPSYLKVPYTHKDVVKWTQKVAKADAYIIVTPEYNHGYPAVLKNALDYVFKEWNHKTVGFVSYGSVGGARAVEQLRQVVIELQMEPIRASVHIVAPWFMLDDNGKLKTETLEASADAMLSELIGKVINSQN